MYDNIEEQIFFKIKTTSYRLCSMYDNTSPFPNYYVNCIYIQDTVLAEKTTLKLRSRDTIFSECEIGVVNIRIL